MIAIVNADVRTCGPLGNLPHGSVLIRDGKLAAVGVSVEIPANAQVIDAGGMILTPGFVDAHTHIGMGWQELAGEADTNESAGVVNAHLRAIDSVNLQDVAFGDALDGGVTTLMILPGKLMIGSQSISPVAGQAVVMKARGDVRGREVLRDPAGMKLALGNDVVAFLTSRKIGPNSRMGIAALLRGVLDEAKRYIAKGQQPGAIDVKLEALALLLKREIAAHVHAHRAADILTALQLAEEYDFEVVIHHATEGHLIAETLAASGAPCVVGPTSVAREAHAELRNFDGRTPAILTTAGVKVSLQTDHPDHSIKQLRLFGVILLRYTDLTADEVMRMLTIHGAAIAGVAARVGSIEAGKDADFAIFSDHPLKIQSRIEQVYVDGEQVAAGDKMLYSPFDVGNNF